MQPFEQQIEKTATFLLNECRESKDLFSKASEINRNNYLKNIITKRNTHLNDAFCKKSLNSIVYHDNKLKKIFENTFTYANSCNWNFIDLTYLLACLNPIEESVIDCIAKVSLTYQAFRMIDDVIDEHEDYKGQDITLYGMLVSDEIHPKQIMAASILPALLMIYEGTSGVDQKYVDLARETLLGALYESAGKPINTYEQYSAMVEGKMVAYGMLLYGPALETLESPQKECMISIMRASLLCSQIANDLLDRIDDARRGQPNFWNILDLHEAANIYTNMLLWLYGTQRDVSEKLRPYIFNRLYDISHYTILGLSG